jgi:hypothetical protein
VSYNGLEIYNITSNDLMLGVRWRFGGGGPGSRLFQITPLRHRPTSSRPSFRRAVFVGVFARPWLEGILARDPHLTLLDAESMGILSPFRGCDDRKE